MSRRILLIAAFALPALLPWAPRAGAVGLSGRIVRPGKRRPPRGRPQPAAPTTKGAGARERTRKALESKRVSFDFVETPLPDVLSFLTQITGVSFTLDARRVPEPWPISLRMNDVSLRSAAAWICRLAGLDYVVGDGAVIVTTPEGVYQLDEKRLRVYDVAMLVRPAINLKNPRKKRKRESGKDLADLVRRTIVPTKWGKAYGTSVGYRAGLLTVVHIERVQRQVKALLDGLR